MPTIQNKRTTAANWTARNVVLAAGELGFETDTNRWKLGDGTTAWNSLAYGSGNVTNGNKGDITVSAAGETWTINAGAVVTADIANSAVTYAKIQNVSATDRLLGRSTAGAGVVEEIVCTAAARSLLDDTTTAAMLTTLGAAASSHTHGNITNAGAIGSTANLPLITTTSGVVTTGAFGTGSTNFCVGNDARLSDTRTPTDGTVTTAKIVDDAVTYAKIQNVSATDRLLGRSTAGAGNIEEITCTAFGRSLLDDADAATARTTLGVTTAASPAFTGNASFTSTTAPAMTIKIDSTVDSGVLALRGRTNDGAALLYFQNNAGTLNNCYIVGYNNQMELYGANYVGPLIIGTTGLLSSQPTYDNTAAGSTVVVTSSGQIRRTSSSLKYKQNIENLEYTLVVNAVENLRPVWYRAKTPSGDDKTTWSHVGLIAEEVATVEPRLVRYRTVEVTEADGVRTETPLETPEPEDVDYGRLAVLLLAEVKALRARVAALENQQ